MPPTPNPPVGIYLSVPFCRAKCTFCNFASGVGDGSAMDRYVTHLCAEITAARAHAAALNTLLPTHADTIYLGGGTPSLLTPMQLQRIFAALHATFTISPTAEITLEAAPGQITDPVLDAAMQLGVNRISLGVQSFIDRECAAVGRLHTGRECISEIIRLRAAGLPEVCADLIAGLPYQTPATWSESLRIATEIGLTHLSVYMLEIDEDSRLGREIIASGQRLHAPAVPSDDISAALYETACAFLPTHGFPQYEISNFAASAASAASAETDATHRSRHNLKYWHRAPYIGFGLDAHSMLPTTSGQTLRFANPDDLAAYPATPETTSIDPRAAFEETIFLGLRLNDGLDLQTLRSTFPRTWTEPLEDTAHDLTRDALLHLESDRLHLTLRGRLISNEVFTTLLETVAA